MFGHDQPVNGNMIFLKDFMANNLVKLKYTCVNYCRLAFAKSYTVQPKCNLTPASRSLSEKLRENLQMGMGHGSGARNSLHQPYMNLWCPF